MVEDLVQVVIVFLKLREMMRVYIHILKIRVGNDR